MSPANQNPARSSTTAAGSGPQQEDLGSWIARLFDHPDLIRMGHNQRTRDHNLGLGWIYYGLARLLDPARVVIIGSWRGFVPMVIARACQDNGNSGEVHFIDPSFIDDFWRDPVRTDAWFQSFGLHNIRHHLCTTQEFVSTPVYRELGDIGLLFVDGYHTAAQARFDYEAFAGRLAPRGLVLFHDSMLLRHSTFYGEDRAYDVDVPHLMDELRQDPRLQLLDLPFGAGLTVMRRTDGEHGEVLSLEPLTPRSRRAG